MSDDQNDVMIRLRALPPVNLGEASERRILARARAAFLRPRPSSRLGRLYFQVEPLLAGAVSAVYLAWALKTAFGLLR